MMSVFNDEIYEKAMKAKNAEELFSLAKENNIPLTQEQAQAYFEQLTPKSGELADEELDNVAGGAGYVVSDDRIPYDGYTPVGGCNS